MPAAQRILINDVPGKAVFALLQYLYTAHLSIPPPLRLYVMELASRLDCCTFTGRAGFCFSRCLGLRLTDECILLWFCVKI